MLKKLIKKKKKKTTNKVLATMLVITLTFANFALLGTMMFESIAVESALPEQDNSTNSNNVKFDAYFDLNNSNAKEIEKDINAEDLVLYVSVSVEGKGRLEEGTIDFAESNFKSKENEKVVKKEIDTMAGGNKIVIDLPMVSRKDSKYKLSLLNMISKIKLTGKYIDENGSITDVNTTKEVRVNWTTNEIKEEDIKISQEIITNKIQEIKGINKRVVQVLVKTKIEGNKAPIERTKIEVENPIKEVKAEEVKVATFKTAATNGGNSIDFNNQKNSAWEYKEEENKTYIELTNKADENGEISWNKNATDEQLNSALEIAQALDVINSKENGIMETLSSKGKNLSGGQRQRLTIARALVRRPDMLILDDSLSALDYSTDLKLRTALSQMENPPLKLIVSQRASSLINADLIIVLDDGEAVGVGKHNELLDNCEVYREIYYSQFEKGGAR